MENISSRLKEYFESQGISQKEIALKTGVQPAYVNKLMNGEKAFGKKTAAKWSVLFGLSESWLLTGSGNMLLKPSDADVVPKISADAGRPFYNVSFEMGYKLPFDDNTTKPDFLIDFETYNKCDFWCKATGQSMMPTIESGDIIALKKVSDFRYLINNEIYAIVTRNDLRTIKRIKDKGDSYLLIPDNPSYDHQEIPKSEILAVFKVMGSMRMF